MKSTTKGARAPKKTTPKKTTKPHRDHPDAPPVMCRTCGRKHDTTALARLPLVDTIERVAVRQCDCGTKLAVVLCDVADCSARGTWIFDESDIAGPVYCGEHLIKRAWAEHAAALEGGA